MLTAMEKQLIRKKLYEFEGKIEHMYKDTKGFITVGVGHLLKDLRAAQKLNFIHQITGKKATKDEIKNDFESIKKSPAGLFASLYKKHTKLKLALLTIDQLTDSHIDSFERELYQIYGAEKFMRFPTNVKLALFDMIFNLGMTKLRNHFPSFNKSVKAKDWLNASKECNRLGIAAARNKYVKDLFSKVARTVEL